MSSFITTLDIYLDQDEGTLQTSETFYDKHDVQVQLLYVCDRVINRIEISICKSTMILQLSQEEGTLKPAANFNVEQDVQILRKAMKGMGKFCDIYFFHV